MPKQSYRAETTPVLPVPSKLQLAAIPVEELNERVQSQPAAFFSCPDFTLILQVPGKAQ